MQTTQNISYEQLQEIVGAIYDQGDVAVKQAYSDLECPTLEFKSADALIKDMAYSPGQKVAFFYYSIYYLEARGYTFEERVELKPESCNGHKFRFIQAGWGLIALQCNFKQFPKIECRITVNSDTRAGNWSQTYPELKDPNLWDWKIINKKAGRLIRLLRKCATLNQRLA
jgi:hypothetical protein